MRPERDTVAWEEVKWKEPQYEIVREEDWLLAKRLEGRALENLKLHERSYSNGFYGYPGWEVIQLEKFEWSEAGWREKFTDSRSFPSCRQSSAPRYGVMPSGPALKF